MRLRLAAALILLLTAPAAAFAATIRGTSGNDRLVGTSSADAIEGGSGNDVILGLGGNDLLTGGLGRDRIFGGPGNDSIAANGDAARDVVSCGTGVDVVDADLGDSVARDCEVTSRQISTDTLTGGGGQHATEVEPDSFSFGRTIVAVFQVGRIESGGATGIGVAVSADAGVHWRSGLLPGMTSLSPQPGADPRASDPTVGYDAAHGVWLATSLGISGDSFQVQVSHSPDGIAWSLPVVARQAPSGSLDKEWLACDNWPSSPNRGHCYVSYLDVAAGILATQTSTDGGLTWGLPVATSGRAPVGLEPNGAQPLPRPDGSLVVVFGIGTADDEEGDDQGFRTDAPEEIAAATSVDGGSTFGPTVEVSSLTTAQIPDLRAPPLPSADVAADGRLFVAWHDCRLDPACRENRILISSSTDGATWTSPTPVAAAGANVSQFVPGLAADPETSGTSQRLAVAYYTLSAPCGALACARVDVWLASSADGGARWSAPRRLDAVPMQLTWLPVAGGRFLGDYISTSFAGGRAVPVYSLAVAPYGGKLREAIMALQTG
ncbi:MAG TPA: hypothetical protein VLJ76_11710 [Gaiellaceae bacterium]|nr:hypothetical protein [Gaiellaceae bacterium]